MVSIYCFCMENGGLVIGSCCYGTGKVITDGGFPVKEIVKAAGDVFLEDSRIYRKMHIISYGHMAEVIFQPMGIDKISCLSFRNLRIHRNGGITAHLYSSGGNSIAVVLIFLIGRRFPLPVLRVHPFQVNRYRQHPH